MSDTVHRLAQCGPVGRIALGTWATFADGVDFTTARRITFRALDAGINHLDTAPNYADGLAEEWLGRFLTAADRNHLVVSTKAFFARNAESGPVIQGLGRKALRQSVEASLRRLRCDCIDLLYCHRPDPEAPLEETLGTLCDLRREGKIHGWGTCRWSSELITRAIALGSGIGLPPPSAAQEPWNRLFPHHAAALAAELTPLGVPVAGYSLLARGTLTGKYLAGTPLESRQTRSRDCTSLWEVSDIDISRIRRLVELSESLRVDPAALLIVDALRAGPCHVILTAASTPEQVTVIAKGIALAQDKTFVANVEDIFHGNGS